MKHTSLLFSAALLALELGGCSPVAFGSTPCLNLSAKKDTVFLAGRGFSPEVAERLTTFRPALAKKLLQATETAKSAGDSVYQENEAVRVFRGIHRDPLGFEARGWSDRGELWTTDSVEIAFHYAAGLEHTEGYWRAADSYRNLSKESTHFGIVLEMEIPGFLVKPPKYGADSQKFFRLSANAVGDVRYFVKRVGLIRTSSWKKLKSDSDPIVDWISFEQAIAKGIFQPLGAADVLPVEPRRSH